MGLGQLFNRDVQYVATDTSTGQTETFTIVDNLAPDWTNATDYSGGMGIPGAWRCAMLVADTLGGAPWHAYRSRPGEDVQERISPTPLLLEQPSPPDPRVVTLVSMFLDLVWHGNAIALITSRDRSGWPTSFLPVRAEDVHVKRARLGDDTDLPEGVIAYHIGGRWRPYSEVIHVKGPCRPGALRGMGVLETNLNTIRLAEEQQRQARSLGTSGVPTGVIKSTDPEWEPEDAAAIKAGWVRSQRERTIAVLSPTTDFTPIAWDPSKTQLLDARKFSLHESALMFGLDPSWVGVAAGSMTYSNIEQQAVNLIKFSLSGHLQRFEQTLTLHLPRGTEARANLDAILRGDTLTRYQAHQIALTAGFLTVDEVRALENRAPLTPAQRKQMAPPPANPPGPPALVAVPDAPKEDAA